MFNERGKGFSDEQWDAYDRSQKRMADANDRTIAALQHASAALAAGGALSREDLLTLSYVKRATGNGNGTPERLLGIAERLKQANIALRAGPGSGFVATGYDAAGWAALPDKPQTAQRSRLGMPGVQINLAHPNFANALQRDLDTDHEASHYGNLTDEIISLGSNRPPVSAYRNMGEGRAYQRLKREAPERAARNPDNLMELVQNYRRFP